MKIDATTVRRLVTRWRKILLIDPAWEIAIAVHKKKRDCPKPNRNAVAFVYENGNDWSASLHVNAFHVDGGDSLKEAVIHELLHIALSRISVVIESALGQQMRPVALEIIEATTDKLARAFAGLVHR